MPRVSAVVPTFGRPELLIRAVWSVLRQSVTDLELIVVIDGEDPATVARLSEIADPRLSVIVHGTQLGAGRARDTGADASAGEWLAFLDDDDEWLPDKLERQLASAPAVPAVLMTLTRVVRSSADFIMPADPYQGNQAIDEWLFDRRSWLKSGQSFLQTSSLVVPRSLFQLLRFRDTKQHEEWELVIRAVKQRGYVLITVPHVLVNYYVGEKSASLSKTYTWEKSLEWINNMGCLITPRAYSGFCLTVATQVAANERDYTALLPLWRAAFREGSPTGRQIFAFVLLWCLPEGFRRSLRARFNAAKRDPQGDSLGTVRPEPHVHRPSR